MVSDNMVLKNMKKNIIILLILSVTIPLFSGERLPKLFIKQIGYNGSPILNSQIITQKIKDQCVIFKIAEIIDSEKDADYVLSGSFSARQEKNSEEYGISLEIEGKTFDRMSDSVTKKTAKLNLIDQIIADASDYIFSTTFPVQKFIQDNNEILSDSNVQLEQSDDYIDRGRKIVRNPQMDFFAPAGENLYKKYGLQVQVAGGMTLPVNLLEHDVAPLLFIEVPFQFYFFSTELFTLSFIVEGSYNLINKRISLDKYNNLHIFGIEGGFGITLNLPSFRQIGFHLNLTGGYAISFFMSDQYPGQMTNTGDPFIHPGLVFEYDITDRFSLSVDCSYLWVIYVGENIHSLQVGLGAGYRL
jgi:hypothetical protein